MTKMSESPQISEVTKTTPEGKPLALWEGSASVVEQGRHWSGALIWISALVFGSTLIWAFLAQLDQTISVRGRIVPAGRVRR